MPRRPVPGQMPKLTKEQKAKRRGALGRVFKYVGQRYWLAMLTVAFSIFVAVQCNAKGTAFMQTLVDDYITPMVKSGSTDFAGLAHAIKTIVVYYAVGIVATYLYNYLMIYVGQGTLRDLRDDMFEKMEDLPIR